MTAKTEDNQGRVWKQLGEELEIRIISAAVLAYLQQPVERLGLIPVQPCFQSWKLRNLPKKWKFYGRQQSVGFL